ncbi:MAG: hypothetical protein ACT4NY_05065 [Pseudonocardiales bacterium]
METPAVMQRLNEAGRIVLEGRRTDDNAHCSLVVVRELSGTSAIYPHGDDKLGVRLPTTEAIKMARALLADAE